MDWNPQLGRKIALAAVVLLTPVAITACLNIQPKVLGQSGRFDFSAFNNGTSTGSFRFNFALAQTTGSVNTVGIQASVNSATTAIGNCNLSGTGCVCVFQDAASNTIATTNSTQIAYDEPGNYFTCTFPGTAAQFGQVVYVTLNNIAGTVSSGQLLVKTATPGLANSLTLQDLVGPDLDANKVRTVSRYQCQYTFLQKSNVSPFSFDCQIPNPEVMCDPGDGLPHPNFCFLQVKFPFYLYSDTYSTNFLQKFPDRIYNAANGGTLCGQQIKQIDCVGTGSPAFGTPQKEFGIYGDLVGPWQNSISLPSAPDQSSASYGFSAKANSITGNCPPGLSKQVIYTTTLSAVAVANATNMPSSATTWSSNMPGTNVLTEVSDPNSTPLPLQVTQYGQGQCTGTTCSLPISFKNADVMAGTQKYTSNGFTPFCVIPPALLP